MPVAGGSIVEPKKYHYKDHDTFLVNQVPPVQNTWYSDLDEDDVRHIWCQIFQSNDEAVAKDVEVRWTIDGNVYLVALALGNQANTYIYRERTPSAAGTTGLLSTADPANAAYYVDKRGQAYKTEIRMTGVPGTNQILRMRDVAETLEET